MNRTNVVPLYLNEQQELIIIGIQKYKNRATSVSLARIFEDTYNLVPKNERKEASVFKELTNPRTLVTTLTEMETLGLLSSANEGGIKIFSVTADGMQVQSRTMASRVRKDRKNEE